MEREIALMKRGSNARTEAVNGLRLAYPLQLAN